jgi:hypothetical protein
MRSVRLDPELDRRVKQAAAVAGESISQFIRQALAQRAQETLAGHGRERLEDVVGVVHGGGGSARRSGATFADVVAGRAPRR